MSKLDGLARYTAFIDLFEIKKLNLLRSQGIVDGKLTENTKLLETEPEKKSLLEDKEKLVKILENIGYLLGTYGKKLDQYMKEYKKYFSPEDWRRKEIELNAPKAVLGRKLTFLLNIKDDLVMREVLKLKKMEKITSLLAKDPTNAELKSQKLKVDYTLQGIKLKVTETTEDIVKIESQLKSEYSPERWREKSLRGILISKNVRLNWLAKKLKKRLVKKESH
jgi:hypothetical protein